MRCSSGSVGPSSTTGACIGSDGTIAMWGGTNLGGIMVYVVVCEGQVIVEINVEVREW